MGKFALLIRVSEYPEGLSALPAALNDVEAIREVLECPEMGGFDDVKPLLNPTKGQMQHEMEMLFRDRTSEDLLLLYFSGHGITDRDGNFFFSATKTRKDKGHLVKSSAVSARDVYDYMVDCQSDRKVVILDCCHSGAFGDRYPGLRDDNFFTLANTIEELNDVCSGFGKGNVGDHGTQRHMETIVILIFDCSAIAVLSQFYRSRWRII